MEYQPRTLEISVCDRFQVNPPLTPVTTYTEKIFIGLDFGYNPGQFVFVAAHPVRGPALFYSPRVSFATA